MFSAASGGYGNRPVLPNRLRILVVVAAVLILAVFVIDKLVVSPPSTTTVETAIDQLNRHAVKRVTIPAREVTIELNDGKTLTLAVSSDRDLWPAIRRSGADVTIVPRR